MSFWSPVLPHQNTVCTFLLQAGNRFRKATATKRKFDKVVTSKTTQQDLQTLVRVF